MAESIDRRQFLEQLGAGAAASLAVGAVACRGGAPGPTTPPTTTMPPAASPPAATAPPPAPAPASARPHAWIEEATIAGLSARMAAGDLTARAITAAYLDRIAALDRAGPMLRAVIEVSPDAIAIAEALDEERRRGRTRGPLHGIPVLLKDSIDTADRMTTTAGSLALAGSIAPRDATVAARLRAAGAILLGKANMSEWANIRSTRSVSGWSARGGQCVNPYARDRSPCGSSSGSAVAVAASLCAVAIGTETDGSIVCPSAICGIVGVKPTVGLASRAGIIPISPTQDTPGPMARTVADAAIVLGVIAGADPRDPATRGVAAQGYAPAAAAVRGARLGVARAYFGYHPEVDRLVDAAIATLRSLGAEVIDPVDLGPMPELGAAELEVLLTELRASLGEYLAALPPAVKVRSLADVIAFNRAHAAEEMPHFGQELFEQAQAKGPLTSPAYLKARALCERVARTEGIDRVLRAHRLDAIIAPTTGPAWRIDPLLGDHFVGGSSTPAAVAGYPSVTVPVGFVAGMPVGASLFAGRFAEARLLGLALALEAATSHRRPPTYAATIPGPGACGAS